jgi:hypothetical protein
VFKIEGFPRKTAPAGATHQESISCNLRGVARQVTSQLVPELVLDSRNTVAALNELTRMHEGHYVFAQVMHHLPSTTFRRCVERYGGEHRVKRFSCLDQYLCLAFAQLTWRESLRDIEACLRAQSSKLYHLGFRGNIAATLWPMPTRCATGVSMRISRNI